MAEWGANGESSNGYSSRAGGQLAKNGYPGSPRHARSSDDGGEGSRRLDLSKICRDEEDMQLLARLLKCGKGKNVVSELEERYDCKIHIKFRTTPKRRFGRRRSQTPRQDQSQSQVSPQMQSSFPMRLLRRVSEPSAPEYKSTSSTIQNTGVTVKQGDITKETADVIVNVVGPDLDFQKSVISKFICKAGGSALVKALKGTKSRQKGCSIISTVGGNLKCKFVFTVVLQPWTDVTAQNAFPRIVEECFQMCIQGGMTSISLPMLGCGRMLQYPVRTTAETMMQTARKAISTGQLKQVTFVAYSPPEYDALTHVLSQTSSGASGAAAASSNADDSDDDGDAISCSISVSVLTKTRQDVVGKVLSGLDDRLMCTEHITNPENKCLPLRMKGRIHETASKRGQRHIRLEIDQKSGNIDLKGERDYVKACKREIIPMLIGTVNTSDKLKCSSEFWSSIAHEFTQSPPYWSHFPKCRPLPDVFRLYQVNRQPVVVPVDSITDAAVRSLVYGTWDKQAVGQGRDAVGLSHSSIKIYSVERIENLELFAKYAIKRQEFFRALADDGTYEFPRLEDLPFPNKGPIQTHAKLTTPLKEEIFPEINEHYMFHGTKPDVLQTIIHQGLDFRMSSANAMFGMGIYGAESSTKADQYVDSKTDRTPGKKKMLLMRMLIGKSYLCLDSNPKKYRRPPCTSSGCMRDNCVDMHERFDSVVGDGPWLFREFVVYAVDQCYPEYIITYERV